MADPFKGGPAGQAAAYRGGFSGWQAADAFFLGHAIKARPGGS